MRKLYRNILTRNLKPVYAFILIGIISFGNVNAQSSVTINLDNTRQIIRGFGAANILPWRPDMTQDEINTAFGTGDGQLGFSILRLRVPSDENTFSSNLTTAKIAHSMGVTLIASPWSPPASMKTNGNIVGGELKESDYGNFAAYLKKFVDYMNENGAPIYAVSVQNEPDVSVSYESCDYNASQMLKFVKENGKSIGTKVIAPESFQFRRQLSDPLLNDSVACSNFDILGGHIYSGGLSAYPLAESKGKEVWMTEHLTESGHSANIWSYAMDVALEMQQVMNANMSAYVWWYIVRYYGPIGDGEKSTSNPNEDFSAKGEVTKKGYVMSQFSRFIRPGYYRVEGTYQPQTGIYVTAYKDSSLSKIVIVAINTSSQSKEQQFNLANKSVDMFVPYVTTNSKNCAEEAGISVNGGSFTAALEASSITTFVSKGDIVAVKETSVIPQSYYLFQNYPNPFNPTTNIVYQISKTSNVVLKVYDVLGRTVQILVNDTQSPDQYTVVFNAHNLSGGIYFYRLEAGSFTETKKLILMK